MDRILSGQSRFVETICQYCGVIHREILEVEYIESVDAYRINGILARFCTECKDKHRDLKHWRIRNKKWVYFESHDSDETSQSDEKGG